jgi:hypothetical protein
MLAAAAAAVAGSLATSELAKRRARVEQEQFGAVPFQAAQEEQAATDQAAKTTTS